MSLLSYHLILKDWLSHCDKLVATENPLSRQNNSIACAPRACHCSPSALSHALCLIAISFLLAQCPFPVATPMNSVTTWDLLTMTELCHDLKFSCCDLVCTTYTPLCRDKEKSYCGINFLDDFVLCRDIKELCHDIRFSFMPILCCDLKAYVATEKSSH